MNDEITIEKLEDEAMKSVDGGIATAWEARATDIG